MCSGNGVAFRVGRIGVIWCNQVECVRTTQNQPTVFCEDRNLLIRPYMMVASDQLDTLATYGNADKVACAWVPSSESGAISITL